jgi:hypothetical protein
VGIEHMHVVQLRKKNSAESLKKKTESLRILRALPGGH